MTYIVGYRKEDGSIGQVRIGDCTDHTAAREAVIEHLGARTIMVLIQEQ
jgi:hypothetical protein